MKKPRGIRIRLIFMLILLIFIPILLFAAVSQLRLNSAMRESLDSRVQTGLEKSNRSLTLTLEKYDTLLYDLSTDDDIIDMVESLNAGGKNEEMLKINLRRELKHICNRNEGVTGLAIFTRDGNCIYYDGLSSSSSESLWMNSSMNLLQDKMEMYQPVKYVMAAPDTPVYVFSIQRRLIDYRDIHKEVGSILICVNEKVLQKAMERISGEVYYLEQDGRILSAPDDTLIGASIGCDEFWYIGNKKYQDYVVAFAENEVSGWNIVEFYSMEHYRKTMFDQFLLQIGLVLGVGVVLVAAVLIVTRPVIVSVEDMLKAAEEKGEPPFLILLDGIEDPHNLGAIIRTANLVGAHGVVIPKRRAVGLTATVARTSAGALNYTPVAKVTNMVHTIEDLKKEGLWFVCADMGGSTMYEVNLKGPLGLVIGNEGEGVSRLVRETCDFTASIPMRGDIDSLNASVAAGVLAYEILRQRLQG